METVSIKLDQGLAKRLELQMNKFNYATKTEFIRDAIRSKIKELDEEHAKMSALQALASGRGFLKGQGRFKTGKEFEDWRDSVGSEELLDYFEKKLGTTRK